MSDVKPIETLLDGTLYRSRLEARWKGFFNALGIPSEYEKEGYDLNDLWYLPDFWLPTIGRGFQKQGVWVEIKAEPPTKEEEEKARRLSDSGFPKLNGDFGDPLLDKKPVYLFYGDFANIPMANIYANGIRQNMNPAHWYQCPICGTFDVREYGVHDCENGREVSLTKIILDLGQLETEGIQSWFQKEWASLTKVLMYVGIDSPALLNAYDAARQARFEHGRSGN